MSDRLTTEELAALRTAIDRGSAIPLGVSMRSLLDTIDALTAERDEARAARDAARAYLCSGCGGAGQVYVGAARDESVCKECDGSGRSADQVDYE